MPRLDYSTISELQKLLESFRNACELMTVHYSEHLSPRWLEMANTICDDIDYVLNLDIGGLLYDKKGDDQ